MDGEMQALRALLNRENLLLSSVREIAEPQGGRFADREQQAGGERSPWTRSWEDSPEGVRWHTALQVCFLAADPPFLASFCCSARDL